MKVLILCLGFILTQSLALAKEHAVSVEWDCTVTSKTSIFVFYNTQGHLEFNPDIFARALRHEAGTDYSRCLADFQRKIDSAMTKFKEEHCPVSQAPFCYASNDYTNGKVVEKLKSSNFIRRNPHVQIAAVSPGAAAILSGSSATPKSFLEQQVASKDIDLADLNQTFRHQNQTYKVSDFDDVIGANIENIFLNMSREESKQYAQNYLVAKSDLLKSNLNPRKKDQITGNLNQMFAYIYGDKGPEELAKVLECAPEDEVIDPLVNLLQNINNSQKKSGCAPLKAGEHKVFTKDQRNYYSTGDYLLRKNADNKYEAVVNIDFKGGTPTMSPAGMRDKVKVCMSDIAPFLKGPDGKTMEISIISPGEAGSLPANQRPGANTVNVMGSDFPIDAKNYAETINCATILHEVLHLLGLCDEYEETRPRYGNMWNCRVTTKAPSIMRESSETFRKAVAQTLSCDCTSKVCLEVMNSRDENLKKLFVSETVYEITNFDFRTRYCQEASIRSREFNQPDKAVILTHQSELDFNLEFRRFATLESNDPNERPYTIDRRSLKCSCPRGDRSCLSEKNKVVEAVHNIKDTTQCPAFTIPIDTKIGKNDQTIISPPVITLASRPVIPSLLQPNQFMKVLAGNCPGIIDGYLECAEFAYKSSDQGPCNVPDRCHDDKHFLGTQQ